MPGSSTVEDRPAHEHDVRHRFANPDAYLRNDAHIEVRRRAVRELAGSVSGAVLDVGCGDGRISLQFLEDGAQVTLVDPEPKMLARALERVPAESAARVRAHEASLSTFAPDRPYDLVLCVGVLAHVPNVKEAVSSLASWVRPGGLVILQLTDHDEPLSVVYDVLGRLKRALRSDRGGDVGRTNAVELLKVAQDLGLRPVGRRQLWVLPAGFGLLPVRWGRGLLTTLYQSSLADFGTEKLFAFVKAG
jgi:SAM-dependent methyltransferase